MSKREQPRKAAPEKRKGSQSPAAKARRSVPRLVDAPEMCRLLAGEAQEALTRSRLSQLVAEGMPKASRGMYDPMLCMYWYLGRLRPAVQRKATEGDDGKPRNLMAERARLTSAQADIVEMERDDKRGNSIPIELYRQKMSEWAVTTKQLVLGVATRLAPKLEGQPRAKIRIALDEALKGCLTDVATRRAIVAAPDVLPVTARKPRKRR